MLDMQVLLLYTSPSPSLQLSRHYTSLISFSSHTAAGKGGEEILSISVYIYMEAKLLPQSRSPLATASKSIPKAKRGCCPTRAVMARPTGNIGGITEKLILKPAENKADEEVQRSSTVYDDKWVDLMAINHLSQALQAATGVKSRKSGYDSLVEAATMMSKKFNPNRQQELVIRALESAIPSIILSMASLVFTYSFLLTHACDSCMDMQLTHPRAVISNKDGIVKQE